jgi:RNA polymerase sigma factor (sigma-70 family)
VSTLNSESGDEQADGQQVPLSRLFQEHNQALIRFLMSRVDSEQEARDVAQEAYVRMLQLDSRGTVSLLSSYLFKTAANIAIDRMRNRSVGRRVLRGLGEGSTESQAASPERILQSREEIELIERSVAELPPKCRQAFYLHRLHDLGPLEIAARLGVSKRMVHHYLVQAMAHIHSRLDGSTLDGAAVNKERQLP